MTDLKALAYEFLHEAQATRSRAMAISTRRPSSLRRTKTLSSILSLKPKKNATRFILR